MSGRQDLARLQRALDEARAEMSVPRWVIRSTCSDGTRQAYWQGICPTSGRSSWTREPGAAVRFAQFADALVFAGACIQVGTARPEQYDVVDLGDLRRICAVSAARA